MKIQREKFSRPTMQNFGATKHQQSGSVVFILITLLAIMMILVAANGRALLDLHRQTKLLEHRQVERLNASQTNTTGRTELPPGSGAQQRVPAGSNGTK